jgi:hypothetical protein
VESSFVRGEASTLAQYEEGCWDVLTPARKLRHNAMLGNTNRLGCFGDEKNGKEGHIWKLSGTVEVAP